MVWHCLQAGIWRTLDWRWHAVRVGSQWRYWREDFRELRNRERRPIAGTSGFCATLRDVKIIAGAWYKIELYKAVRDRQVPMKFIKGNTND